jgi:hypothetical protein
VTGASGAIVIAVAPTRATPVVNHGRIEASMPGPHLCGDELTSATVACLELEL